MSKDDLVVVTGAGGFIGGHLVRALLQRGHTKIRAVDVQPLNEWYQQTPGVENQVGNLALLEHCRAAARGARMIYDIAADISAELMPSTSPSSASPLGVFLRRAVG